MVGSVQGYFADQKARQYHLPRSALVGVQRWGTRGHRHLIAASRDLAARLQEDAPCAEVSIIPLGVAHEEIAESLERPPAPAARQIVYLGRLETSQKGLDLLISACEGLLSTEDARLVLAGDGHDARAVRALAAASPEGERIDFVGRVDGGEKWRLLAASQICVMPSRYETFGLIALEALACGTPVVGFDIESLQRNRRARHVRARAAIRGGRAARGTASTAPRSGHVRGDGRKGSASRCRLQLGQRDGCPGAGLPVGCREMSAQTAPPRIPATVPPPPEPQPARRMRRRR